MNYEEALKDLERRYPEPVKDVAIAKAMQAIRDCLEMGLDGQGD